MACPPKGRVLIPAGTYSFVCLFLKDSIDIELAEGAELSAVTDRTRFPYYPGMVERTDGQGQLNLGTWEGDPQTMFCGLITGTSVKHVNIYGKGTLNGNTSHGGMTAKKWSSLGGREPYSSTTVRIFPLWGSQ